MLHDIHDLIFDDDTDFIEKSRELRGWSLELRNWQVFFESMGFDGEIEGGQTIGDLFRKPKGGGD